jgi:hypothetical protein
VCGITKTSYGLSGQPVPVLDKTGLTGETWGVYTAKDADESVKLVSVDVGWSVTTYSHQKKRKVVKK